MDVSAIRTDMNLKARELARRLGISAGHMADLESGRRKLTLPLASKLEEIAGRGDIVSTVVREQISQSHGETPEAAPRPDNRSSAPADHAVRR